MLKVFLLLKNIVINGNGHTLDAKNLARIFNISQATVVINNLNFINANCDVSYYDGSGGAIFANYSDLTINNCTFEKNNATRGGAIYASYSDLTINNCNFENCSADDNGGAIVFSDDEEVSEFCVMNCNFVNCSADFSGAIYANGFITMDNCSVINTSSVWSGAICTHNGINVTNSTFINNFIINTYYGFGAAICTESDSIIKDSFFINNHINIIDGIGMSFGGAVYAFYAADISNSTFVNNTIVDTEGSFGGAIYANYDLNVEYCIFDANNATMGKDIFWEYYENCSYSLDNNYWSMNFTTKEEFINADLVSIEDENEDIYSVAPNNWAILNISKDNCDYSVDFVGNDGSALNESMPVYTAKLNINDMVKEITIKNNTFKDDGVCGDYLLTSPNSANVLARATLIWDDVDYEISTSGCVYGENATVTVKVNPSATGNITVKSDDGQIFTGIIDNGVVTITLSNLNIGVHNLNISYSGDKNYLPFKTTAKVTVNKVGTVVSVSVDDISYGDNATVSGTVSDVNGNVVDGEVALFVNGTKVDTVSVKDGEFSAIISDLGVGVYNIAVVYDGDDIYSSSNASANVTVLNATGSFNVVVSDIVYGDGFIINITDAVGVNGALLSGIVDVSVGGKVYSFDVFEGMGSYEVSDILPAGTYVVNASLIVPNYDNIVNNTSFVVAKVPTKFIDATNGTVYNGKYYSVRLTDNSGNAIASKNVAIKIAGKTYNVKTDKNGLAKVKLALTSKYLNKALTVTYKFSGDNNLKASSGSSKIKVIKTSTKIVNATKLVVKNHKYFYVKLTTKSGKVLANKVVTMKSSVSGKTYKIKTNSKGIAKIDLWVKIKPLGKYYKYTFKYAGSNYYNSCTKTFKIKIVK